VAAGPSTDPSAARGTTETCVPKSNATKQIISGPRPAATRTDPLLPFLCPATTPTHLPPAHPPHPRPLLPKASAIQGCLLFSGLPSSALASLVDSMTPLHASPGTDIIRQGDAAAATFYVLEAGKCEVGGRGRGRGGARRGMCGCYAPPSCTDPG
jgi:hypothetical protein